MSKVLYALVFVLALVATTGCSVKQFAINKLGDSLANSGTVYAADEDIELIGGALPFSLKLVEALLAESPKHRVHAVPPDVEAEWRTLAESVYPKIRGSMVPAEMFDRAKELAEW